MNAKLCTLALVVGLAACRKEEPTVEPTPVEESKPEPAPEPWEPKPIGGTGGGPTEQIPPPTPNAPAKPKTPPPKLIPSAAPTTKPPFTPPWVQADGGISWPPGWPWIAPSAAPSSSAPPVPSAAPPGPSSKPSGAPSALPWPWGS